MNQYQTIPIITTLPHFIRSDTSLCQRQKAPVIAPPDSEVAFKGPLSACHVPGSTGFDLEGRYTVTVSVPSANCSEFVEVEPDLSIVKSEDGSAPVSLHLKEVIDLTADNEEMLLQCRNPTSVKLKDNSDNVISIIQKDQTEKVAKIVHKDHNEFVEVEPDLSIVKSELCSAPVSLHLKEVIDLTADNEEMLLQCRNPTSVQLKDNIDNVISIIQNDQSEKVAKIVHKDYNEPIPLIVHKDHSEKVTGIKLKDHCEKVTFMHNDESYIENDGTEMDSSNSHVQSQIDENSTIFSEILKQASPNKCHQTFSHVPVNPVPVFHQSLSDSSKSPTDSQVPHLSSGKAQLVIAKIKSWTKSEVHDWCKSHHMDKICPKLSSLDGEGLQRLALQYMHDSDSFYTGVKRRLRLSVFQTLVICRSMKELTDI